jgi:hypothetical protein
MTDQQDRPVDPSNNSLDVLTVAAAETAQRIRRSDDRHVFAKELVIQTTKARRVGERAVDENNGGTSHFYSPRFHRMNGPRASGDVGIGSTGDLVRA